MVIVLVCIQLMLIYLQDVNLNLPEDISNTLVEARQARYFLSPNEYLSTNVGSRGRQPRCFGQFSMFDLIFQLKQTRFQNCNRKWPFAFILHATP